MSDSEYSTRKAEILTALKKLDEVLSQQEKDFLLAFTTGGSRVQATDIDVNARELLSKQNVHIEKS
jgi:hypothetical protein